MSQLRNDFEILRGCHINYSLMRTPYSLESIEKTAVNYPWGRLNYYEKEKKFGAQFTVEHEKVTIAGFQRQDEKHTWNIGGIQNINRTDEARKIREKLSNGIKLHWYKVNTTNSFLGRIRDPWTITGVRLPDHTNFVFSMISKIH